MKGLRKATLTEWCIVRYPDITPLQDLPVLKDLFLDCNCLDTTMFCPTMYIINSLEQKGCYVSFCEQNYEYIAPDLPALKDNGDFIECFNLIKLCTIPNSGGLYFFYDEEYTLLYVGKAAHLSDRIKAHLQGYSNTKDVKQHFEYIRYILLTDAELRETYETYYINTMQPKLNIEKTFTYESSRFAFKYLYGDKWEKF